MKSNLLLFIFLTMMVFIGGCSGGGSSDDGGSASITTGLIKSTVPYNDSPAHEETDFHTLVSGFSDFTIDFYHEVVSSKDYQHKNIFFSPYSIENALAMTWAGANYQTADEMAQALHLALSQETFHRTLNALNIDLNSRDDHPPFSGDAFHLNLVNSIWSRIGYPFLASYLDVIAENYDAGVRVTDFVGDPDGSRQIINQWVEDQTHSKITELLPPGSISNDTSVVLTNAIYFKVSWYYKFDEKATVPGDFLLLDGTIVKADLMHRRMHTKYFRDERFDAVELPYVSPRYDEYEYPEELSMLLIIPHQGEFETVANDLTSNSIDSIVLALAKGEVVMTLPRFEFECEVKCKDIMQKMGMTDAFDPVRADFSQMVAPEDSTPWIDEIYHKAFIAVDEEGTEAAAATAIVMKETAIPDPVVISADRPFIFLIRDNITGTILFMGNVLDPTKG